jgi:hypothetical protein
LKDKLLHASCRVLNTITQGIAVNSTAYRPEGSRQFVGNKTEGALLAWAEKLGGDYRVCDLGLFCLTVRPCKGIGVNWPKRFLQLWGKWSDWDILRLIGKLFE